MNTNQMHFNVPFAERTRFGQPLVNSAFTLALVTGLTVPDTSENAAANLAWTDIKLPKPVFVGDTLWAESEILDAARVESHPNVGIVSMRCRGINQRREVVIEFRRTFMVYKRDAPEVAARFPAPMTSGRSERSMMRPLPSGSPSSRHADLDDDPAEASPPPSCTSSTRSAAAWRRTRPASPARAATGDGRARRRAARRR